MATSGSNDFELDVAEYIEEAYERCGLMVRTGNDLKTAKRSLNLMFADWANRGLNRWTMTQETLSLATGVAEYPLGTLSLIVSSSSGFTIGETVTGGTSEATAIVTALPAASSDFEANTLVITVPVGTFVVSETVTGGTSTTSSSVSVVPSFEDTQSSIDILSAVVRKDAGTTTQNDVSISRISRDEFLSIPSKKSSSRPTQFYIDRSITPVIKLWPTPDSNDYVLVYDRMRRIFDADTFTNTLDVPFRFYPCLAAGLAYYLSLKMAPQLTPLLKQVYEEEFKRAAEEDRDRASLTLTPSSSYYSSI